MQPLTARLTADATVKTFDSGRSVVNFNVAQNRSYKNKEGVRVNITRFYECSYWLSTSVAPYLTKGQLVELEGEVSARAYLDKQGEPKAVLQFMARYINFHSPQKRDSGSNAAASNDPGDDLPF